MKIQQKAIKIPVEGSKFIQNVGKKVRNRKSRHKITHLAKIRTYLRLQTKFKNLAKGSKKLAFVQPP